MRYANILATGRYVPEKVLTNADVERIIGEPVDAWLQQNVGIKQRHLMADDQVTSDLCVAAAKQAMERAGVKPGELDLIVVATDTPDYLSPATSSVVQAKLGAGNAGTYDLNCACAGWVTALDVASKTIAADESYQRVLVVGAYGMSRYINWKDKKTCTLFADGAGAVVLGASDKPGFLGAKLLAAGEYHDALGVYTGGTYRPSTAETLALTNGKPAVQFVRKFPATFNTERWPMLLKQLLERAKLTMNDVDHFVFTQLNLRTIEATMKVLEQPMSKTNWTMDKWGYTGSACIPMTLDDAVVEGRVKKGDLVALCASGGGLAMASALYRWTA
ncbi:ketoacyl-ACP synthase III [Archangium violaceum]|uniref:3-oxoacyl-ACP synthase III family protein n=1 Tax=Archangium violaceum TaxID=83451 RepID=UPI0019524EF5|nr:ketoacyl-ACP synthase III [Archangium violaceum]QRN97103.1 ketoacyl-ACP synthase III [Archangium violaceum]